MPACSRTPRFFAAAARGSAHAPNTNVCPVCLGFPGALPVLNRRAVDFAAKAALALELHGPRTVDFCPQELLLPGSAQGLPDLAIRAAAGDRRARSNSAPGGAARRVRITRVHMEEDAGKSLHEGFPDSDRKTYLDFNRSGTPLIEIVTEPDLRSADDAAEAFRRLREILIALGVNDGNMEEGSLRCDANVSVRPAGTTTLGTKTEVKNINSFRFLEKALEYEIARQVGVLRRRRHDRAGNAAVGRGRARDVFDAQQGRRARLPLFSRTRSAARADRRAIASTQIRDVDRRIARSAAPARDGGIRAVRARSDGTREHRADAAVRRDGAGVGPAARGVQLGVRRSRAQAERARRALRSTARVSAAGAGGLDCARRERRPSARRSARSVFEKMYETGRSADDIVAADGLAQIGDEGAIAVERARGDRGQSGRRGADPQRQDGHVRFSRGSGDEGHRRQGQPDAGERSC